MAQYDVYSDRSGRLFLDVQSDLLEDLSTRMVVPLLALTAKPPKITRLHPVLTINGEDFLLSTNMMAAVEKKNLGVSKTNLLSQHDDISRAIYMLFQGF